MANRKKTKGTPAPRPEEHYNYPLPELRSKIETAIEVYTTRVAAGRDRASEAWQIVPLAQHMRRRGQITEDEEEAARRFYRDFVLGMRVTGLTMRYGERAGKGGTPAAQLAADSDFLAPDELRTHYHTKFINACRAINHMPTIEWMVRVICEQLMAGEVKPPSLTDVGRAYLGWRQDQQASASGATLIKSGLERLVVHYGIGHYCVTGSHPPESS